VKPVILGVGRVGERVIVAGGASVLLGDLAATGLASVLAVRDPIVNLVVGPMLSVDQLLPLADLFGVVLLHLSRLHPDKVV